MTFSALMLERHDQIDFAGTVEQSSDARYPTGDKVVLTGLATKQTMAIGTAGFAAGLAVVALEDHGLQPDQREVLVTGAAGGAADVPQLAAEILERRIKGRIVVDVNDSGNS